MDTTPTTPGLTPLPSQLSTEDYWARMQALREDLVRLRPAEPRDRTPRAPSG